MNRLLHLIACAAASVACSANHSGGEIRYWHLSGLTYRIEVRLFVPVGAPSGTSEIWVNIAGDELLVPSEEAVDSLGGNCGGSRIQPYAVNYTFAGPGVHWVCAEVNNRSAGIINIPNSINQPIALSAQIVVSPFVGGNSSVQFTNPPNQAEWVWSTWVHDPGAVDPDGDSLSFELVSAHGIGCGPIMGYQFPYGPNFAWLDPATGVFHWSYPPMLGAWNLCIRANEWRNGALIGQVTRDMTICVDQIANDVAEAPSPKPMVASVSTDGDWLHLLGPGSGVVQVDVLDQLGATVRSHRVEQGLVLVPLAGLAPGAYFVRAIDGLGPIRQARFVRP